MFIRTNIYDFAYFFSPIFKERFLKLRNDTMKDYADIIELVNFFQLDVPKRKYNKEKLYENFTYSFEQISFEERIFFEYFIENICCKKQKHRLDDFMDILGKMNGYE